MKQYLLLLFVLFVTSCKKEGLSKTTGNIEIAVPSGDWVPQWEYSIYTGEQFNLFLDYKTSYPIRWGFSHIGKISEKELPAGTYGIHFYQNGTGYKKIFSVAANKVNKISLP
jgi:hypothetical protein